MADKIVVMHDGHRRADRHAARSLRPAGQPLRRRLHRLAGDEFLQGADHEGGRFLAEGGVSLPLQWRRQRARRAGGRHLWHPARAFPVGAAGEGVAIKIKVVEPTGSETQVVAECSGQEVVCVFRERILARPGETIRVAPDAALAHLFDETSGRRIN